MKGWGNWFSLRHAPSFLALLFSERAPGARFGSAQWRSGRPRGSSGNSASGGRFRKVTLFLTPGPATPRRPTKLVHGSKSAADMSGRKSHPNRAGEDCNRGKLNGRHWCPPIADCVTRRSATGRLPTRRHQYSSWPQVILLPRPASTNRMMQKIARYLSAETLHVQSSPGSRRQMQPSHLA
jgi:hypothetical protein